jgi:CrcB protein
VQQRQQTDPSPREPIDPDVDLHLARPARHVGSDATVLAVIAAGGTIGATARYLTGLTWPAPPGGFPWATLIINIVGCALIGVLMVLVTDVWTRQRLLRPFLGTGVLGGFTTFSTYALDIQHLVTAGHPGTGLLYLASTAAGALIAVWITAKATRALSNWRKR